MSKPDRVTRLATSTLDLGTKLDEVLRIQAEHGAKLDRLGQVMTENHTELNAKLNAILAKLG